MPKIFRKPHPGAQTEALKAVAHELIFGGIKGGGMVDIKDKDVKMNWVEIRVKTILGYIKVKIVSDDDTFKHDMDEMMEYSDLIYKASENPQDQ